MGAEMTMLPGGHVMVTLSGEIDTLTAPAARNALAEATGQAVTGVIADLAQVTFLDAAALGALAGASSRARHLPGGLRLVAAPPRAMWLMHMTGLDNLLAVFPAPPRCGEPADARQPPQPPPDLAGRPERTRSTRSPRACRLEPGSREAQQARMGAGHRDGCGSRPKGGR